MLSLKKALINLDIFDSSTDLSDVERENEARSNKIATRILIITVVILLINLGLFYKLRSQNTLMVIPNPDQDNFFRLPSNAHCPCSRTLLFYDEFISIETRFHQVCSSDFISDRWIQAINTGLNVTYYYYKDFRVDGSAAFQALAGFCRLSEAYVLQSIDSFKQESLLTQAVLKESIFQLQMDAAIQQFQTSVAVEFIAQLKLIQETVSGSQIMSGLQTNYVHQYFIPHEEIPIMTFCPNIGFTEKPLCSCCSDIDCRTPSKIYNIYGELSQLIISNSTEILMEIPGFLHGCLPVQSIFASTLECFYNQTCVDTLVSFFPTTENFTSLKASNQSRFKSNDQIENMIHELLVEEWMINISYSEYYKRCATSACTYLTSETEDIIIVCKILIGLLGTLVMILSPIIQYIVQYIKRRRQPNQTPSIPWKKMVKPLLKKLVIELNMLQHHGSNEQHKKYQRIGTRIYICLLLICMIIVIFYTVIIKNIHRKTILNPTQLQYDELYRIHGDDLFCSCSSVSMEFADFISIEISFHQVCSSDFISNSWFDYMNQILLVNFSFYLYDFRIGAPYQFQILLMLCREAQKTLNNSLNHFRQRKFFSSQILSQSVFDSKFTTLIRNWQSYTVNRFLRIFELFRATVRGNQLLSDLSSMKTHYNQQNDKVVVLEIPHYSNCSCALSSSCLQTMGMYDVYQSSIGIIDLQFVVPNFFLGCFPVEALLQSTLECFFNVSCMLEIEQHYANLNVGLLFNFQLLNASLNSPDEKIESIVDRMMIQSWPSTVSFSSYYQKCAPSSCSYEYMARNSLVFVITAIIGISSGLSIGLKLSILCIVRLIEKLSNITYSRREFHRLLKMIFAFDTERQKFHRSHFMLLLIAMSCVLAFNSLTSKLVTIDVAKPTLAIYQDLTKSNFNSLQCSCSQISVPYQSFISIQIRFHHLCSSHFVSHDWLTHLYNQYKIIDQPIPTDYRSSAVGQFTLLTSLCQLSHDEVNHTFSQLLVNEIITTELLSEDLLAKRIQIILNHEKRRMSQSFLNDLNLIREVVGANMIMSTWSTNWIYVPDNVMEYEMTAHTIPVTYDECNCGKSWQCTEKSQGMMVGCYPLEALLQTTLECFYNQTCIDTTGNFAQLDQRTLQTSHFQINSTISSLLKNLMMEESLITFSYENYFKQCAPSSCVYSYMKIGEAMEAIVTIISLYGGLVLLTKCTAFILIRWYYEGKKNRVHPPNLQ